MEIDNEQKVEGISAENKNTLNDFEIENEASRINDIDKNGNIMEERKSSPKINDDGKRNLKLKMLKEKKSY